MNNDKSSRRKGKHSLSVSHAREGGKVELVEDLHASHTSKDRTGRWRRGGGGARDTQVRKETELGGISQKLRKQNMKAKCGEVFSR